MKLAYFAWVRETIGRDGEELQPPADVDSVASLIDWLSARSPEHAEALARRDRLRFAVDDVMAGPETPLGAAREVAIFPPVTGG